MKDNEPNVPYPDILPLVPSESVNRIIDELALDTQQFIENTTQWAIKNNPELLNKTLSEALLASAHFEPGNKVGFSHLLAVCFLMRCFPNVRVSSEAIEGSNEEIASIMEPLKASNNIATKDRINKQLGEYNEIAFSAIQQRNSNIDQALQILIKILPILGVEGVGIEEFRITTAQAYRVMQIQSGLGQVETQDLTPQPVEQHPTSLMPIISKETQVAALVKIIINWYEFVNSTMDELVISNPVWAGRLKLPLLDKKPGFEEYLLFASLVCFCFLREFEKLGKPFPVVLRETDEASEIETLTPQREGEKEGNALLKQKQVENFERLQKENLLLVDTIAFLFKAFNLYSDIERGGVAHMGFYHASKSLRNQIESDYWQGKIRNS